MMPESIPSGTSTTSSPLPDAVNVSNSPYSAAAHSALVAKSPAAVSAASPSEPPSACPSSPAPLGTSSSAASPSPVPASGELEQPAVTRSAAAAPMAAQVRIVERARERGVADMVSFDRANVPRNSATAPHRIRQRPITRTSAASSPPRAPALPLLPQEVDDDVRAGAHLVVVADAGDRGDRPAVDRHGGRDPLDLHLGHV